MSIKPVLAALLLFTACSGDDDAAPQPDTLALPGMAYYPESLHADDAGTLYVGSLATGQLVAYDDGATLPRTIVAGGGASGITGLTGVHVHDGDLWVCSVDTTFQRPTAIVRLSVSGAVVATYPLAATQFCNDLEFDAGGTLYATDSFSGTILRLRPGASALESWVTDPRFVPASAGAFGLDGIAIAGGAIYVDKLDSGELFRIDAATGAITTIAVTLAGPDGLRALDDHTLLVVEGGAGQLTRLALSGDIATATVVRTGLDQPTAVTVARGSAWVAEGQLGRLFAMPAQTPNLPFAVQRVDL
jgi:sugar lactone lactonase YvrE